MKRTSRFIAGIAAIGLVAGGCGDSGGGFTGDQLAADEATAIFGELFAIGFGGVGASAPAPMGVAAAAAEPIPTTTVNCEGGGSVTLSGNVTSGTNSYTFDITEKINACKIDHDGTMFTVNGDPDIKVKGNFSMPTQTTLSGNMEMSGGFTYTSSDGRSGGCGISIKINLSTFSTSGSVCGQSISGSAG